MGDFWMYRRVVSLQVDPLLGKVTNDQFLNGLQFRPESMRPGAGRDGGQGRIKGEFISVGDERVAGLIQIGKQSYFAHHGAVANAAEIIESPGGCPAGAKPIADLLFLCRAEKADQEGWYRLGVADPPSSENMLKV